MENYKTLIVTLISFFVFIGGNTAQDNEVKLQTLRGEVIDRVTGKGIPNVLVELLNHTPRIAAISKEDGAFELENVPVGYQRIRVNGYGYYDVVHSELVIAGKQSVIKIKMEEEFTMDIATIETTERGRFRNTKMMTIDEMNVVSARPFNIEETNRYITGFGGPARAVTNYPGLLNTDDAQNYIVSRGNSPYGIQWMVEGVPIENPHHFATMGNTGALFPLLNNNLLASSDFINGAFAAQYNNVYAGMFDINMRKGNNERHEFSAQLSVYGAELIAEGPFKKKGASFAVAARAGIFDVLQKLGMSLGTNAAPRYYDLNFKIDIPTKDAGHFSFFGVGGISDLAVLDHGATEDDAFANAGINFYINTGFGLVGFNHSKFFENDISLKTTLSYLIEDYKLHRDTIFPDTLLPYFTMHNLRQRVGLSSIFNKKFSTKLFFRAGVNAYVHFIAAKGEWRRRNELHSLANDIQVLAGGFVETRYKISSSFAFVLGLQGMYWSLNENSWALEPRVALDWRLGRRHRLSLGYGWHSKIQSFAVSFLVKKQADGSYDNSNRELGLNRSHQLALSYDAYLAKYWGIKANAYVMYNTDIAVQKRNSSFSIANYGNFAVYPDSTGLESKGKSVNYGVEFSLEKFFNKGLYGLLSAAYQRALYQGSDEVWRNSAFDAQYVTSLVMGKEFKIGKKKRNVIYGDCRFNLHGGLPYTPIDLEASKLAGREILLEDQAYSKRLGIYKRIDVRIGARFNHRRKRVSHHVYVVIQNVALFKNDFEVKYNPATEQIVTTQQFGFVPNLFYQVFF
ncbi:TonB-dependent receptor [Aureispira anguillae]|uniref:TonB-dependent receptor n=1 Tax=Aureispira anguillae TaxID=2864201 RepID=A0A916DVZ0_9BACT|nr:TonB-dependent receptor [Aureispira anguillae]BDS14901.1 TonB-dependent receptor [Aureispira anguillae]